MIKKIINYYKCFGFNETLKKIKRYLCYRWKNNGNEYRLDNNEKKEIVLKNKNLYFFTFYSYSNLDERLKNSLIELNMLGFNIKYIYIEENNKEKPPDIAFYGQINKLNCEKFNFSYKDICLFYGYNNKFDELYKKIVNNKCQCYLIKDEKSFHNKKMCNLSISDIPSKFIEKKCPKEFYNNISVVVLNYNNKDIIDKCIDSLIKFNQRYNYEIIVVDNQSSDGSYEIIKKKYKKINLYQNSKNGCSSGRNLGVSKSTKEYIIFLDSDQWVLNEFWLDNYIDIIMNDSNIGAVGWAGGWFNKKGYAFHTFDNFESRYMPPSGLYRKDIGYLGTGGFMISKKLFNCIGGFDLYYDPTCYEDTDLSLKVRNYGKEIVYCPYLIIEHNAHQSTKSGSDAHEKMIKEKGNYFVNKWKKINPELLKYRK